LLLRGRGAESVRLTAAKDRTFKAVRPNQGTLTGASWAPRVVPQPSQMRIVLWHVKSQKEPRARVGGD
jgi:hypothetical protein